MYVDIQIGFSQPLYTFSEPSTTVENISDVMLIREGGRQSEQTFFVSVDVAEPGSGVRPATPRTIDASGDYSVETTSGFSIVEFPPHLSSVSLPLTLLSDTIPEGLEAFKVTANPSEGFANFGNPQSGNAFAATEVQIVDNDCELI